MKNEHFEQYIALLNEKIDTLRHEKYEQRLEINRLKRRVSELEKRSETLENAR